MKTRTALIWPARPTTKNPMHDLGRRQRWTSACGRYRVERFMESTRLYIPLFSEPRAGYVWHSLVRSKNGKAPRTLKAAQRLCQEHERQTRREAQETQPRLFA